MDVLVIVTLVSFSLICVKSDETTTDTTVVEITDAPKYSIDDVMFVDDGKYSTQNFNYDNDQSMRLEGDKNMFNGSCYEEYIRCVISRTAEAPVCAYNDVDNRPHGFFDGKSICEVHLDNCRRGFVVWRILDYGVCRFWYNDEKDNIFETRRNNDRLKKLPWVLASRSTNDINKTGSRKISNTHDSQWAIYHPQREKLAKNPLDTHKFIAIYSYKREPNADFDNNNEKYKFFMGRTEKENYRWENKQHFHEMTEKTKINFRRNNSPVSVDLLKMLAKRSGNNEMRWSNVPSVIHEPSRLELNEGRFRRFESPIDDHRIFKRRLDFLRKITNVEPKTNDQINNDKEVTTPMTPELEDYLI